VSAYLYDSAARSLTPRAWAARLWRNGALVRLLVSRELRIRYKRSLLGVWWTLLSPLLEMAALAVVFSQVFRFSSTDVPYVVYLLSGIVVAGLMRNAILRTASSLSENAQTLTKMRVPAEIFSLAAALEVAVNFLVSLLPLIAIMLIAGASVSPTAPLIVVPTVLVFAFALGVGMMLAPVVARFLDTLALVGILLGLVIYLAPVFYPFSIVPERFRFIVELNPLYHFMNIFRDMLYGDSVGSLGDYLIGGGYAVAALAFGGWLFARGSTRAIALL
jgi:ABC-type polysaccharide/polyol phosphate export permease